MFVDEKRREFLSLVQGYKTIAKYEKKITELPKYTIAFILDEEDKCKHFEESLRTAIRALVMASVIWLDFSNLIEVAIHVEKCLAEGDEEKMIK